MSNEGHQDSRVLRSTPAFLVSLIALAGTLVAVGNVRVQEVSGLPFVPGLTLWLLPVSRLIADLSGAATLGLLVTVVFLLPRTGSRLSDQSKKIAEIASYSAFIYAGANLSLVIFGISDILGTSPSTAFHGQVLRSYLTQLSGGRVSLFQIASALLISLIASRIKGSVGAAFVLLVALLSVGAPALTGHSGLSSNHEIATSSLAVHILALSIWIGGLFALTMVVQSAPTNFAAIVQRFSHIALGCYLAVIVSGAANAWVRLRSFDNLINSNFGRLILLKLAFASVLTYFGWLNRTRGLVSLRAGRDSIFYRIAGIEVAIMFAIVGVAVTLSRTAFPPEALSGATKPTASELLYGFKLPPTPSVVSLLTHFRVDAIWLAFALLLITLYLLSLGRVRRAGITWPTWRLASFGFGVVLLIFATSGGLASYAHVLFSAHMVQHILLLLVIPEFLVAGQPFRLASLAHRGDDTPSLAIDILMSKAFKNVSRLPVVATLFASSFYLLYFTPLFPAWLPSHWGHFGMETIIFAVGYLFIWNFFGSDLTPIEHSPWSRFRYLLISEPFHVLFSVLLIWSGRTLATNFYTSLQRPYGVDVHQDQILGGVLGWLLGEVPMFFAGALLIRALAKRSTAISRSA